MSAVNVAIYGASGLGRMVCDILRQGNAYRPAAYLDSAVEKHGLVLDELAVCGGAEQWPALKARGIDHVVVAIGDNETRIRIARELEARGARLASAIHPLAMISPSAITGKHVIIGARVMVCVHAVLGDHSVLSPGSIIEHDNQLGIGVFLDPAVRLAGGVSVDDLAHLGIGACVIPGRRVGRQAIVEPGAVVITDVTPGTRVGGVPAVLRKPAGARFIPDAPMTLPTAPALGP